TTTIPATAASHAWTSGPPERFLLEVHPLETVGSLRARVASSAADFTRLLSGGKTIQVDAATVADAGIKDGSILWTLPSPTALIRGASVGGSAGHQQQQQAERLRLEELARRTAAAAAVSAAAAAGGAGAGVVAHDG
ncbi:unnamed protein product, partial [Ectocarpus sp. 12 AP-2014]